MYIDAAQALGGNSKHSCQALQAARAAAGAGYAHPLNAAACHVTGWWGGGQQLTHHQRAKLSVGICCRCTQSLPGHLWARCSCLEYSPDCTFSTALPGSILHNPLLLPAARKFPANTAAAVLRLFSPEVTCPRDGSGGLCMVSERYCRQQQEQQRRWQTASAFKV